MSDRLELLFCAASQVTGEPWPTEPARKARARAAFSLATAQRFLREVDAKVAEIVALHNAHAKAQAEARELLDQVDAWGEVAASYAQIANELGPPDLADEAAE